MHELREVISKLPTLKSESFVHRWSLYEIGGVDAGRLIAVGSYERGAGDGQIIDVVVLDLTDRSLDRSPIMIGQGWVMMGCVKITPGMVILERSSLRGQGIGTLVFNIVTAWAQRTFPDRRVKPITIIRPNGFSEFERLTRFYGRFGFSWDHPAGGWQGEYPSRPMMVADLKQYPEGMLPQVRSIDLPGAVSAMTHSLVEASYDRRQLANLAEERRRRLPQRLALIRNMNRAAFIFAALSGYAAAWLLLKR